MTEGPNKRNRIYGQNCKTEHSLLVIDFLENKADICHSVIRSETEQRLNHAMRCHCNDFTTSILIGNLLRYTRLNK